MQKILLIEDEKSVASFIRQGLSEEGYAITLATDGESGLHAARSAEHDLIILDIMLPDKNGIEVCRELRAEGLRTPILFLTALNTPENIAWGLDTGGDDYLGKPFKLIELHARVKALLRRAENSMAVPEPDRIRVADLEMDDHAKTVDRGGERINLTPTEYRLLLALVRNKGRVMSRTELLDSVWDINFDMGTNIVDVYINYVRKKLDGPERAKLIHTVVGMGYTLREPS